MLPLIAPLCFLALVYAYSPIKQNQIGIDNLRKQLYLKKYQAHWMMFKVCYSYIMYFLEAFCLKWIGTITVVNQNEFDDFLKQFCDKYDVQGKGFLWLAGHVSSLEMVCCSIHKAQKRVCDSTMVILARPTHNKFIDKLVELYRKNDGYKMIWTGGPQLFDEIAEYFNKGYGLGLAVDQKPSKGGVFVRFFSEHAAFPRGGAKFAIQHGLPVLHAQAVRIGPGIFKMYWGVGLNHHVAINKPDMDIYQELPAVTKAFISGSSSSEFDKRTEREIANFAGWLENVILRYPSQWFWNYKKWSRKPKDNKSVSAKSISV